MDDIDSIIVMQVGRKMIFLKNHYFAENWRKSPKTVTITLSPGDIQIDARILLRMIGCICTMPPPTYILFT
jgi:hypothetical protein